MSHIFLQGGVTTPSTSTTTTWFHILKDAAKSESDSVTDADCIGWVMKETDTPQKVTFFKPDSETKLSDLLRWCCSPKPGATGGAATTGPFSMYANADATGGAIEPSVKSGDTVTVFEMTTTGTVRDVAAVARPSRIYQRRTSLSVMLTIPPFLTHRVFLYTKRNTGGIICKVVADSECRSASQGD